MNSFQKRLSLQKLKVGTTALVAIIAVAGVGVYLLSGSHAASPYASVAATTGTLNANAAVCADSSAINGNKVVFGDGTCSPSTGTGTGTGGCAAPAGTLTITICGNKFVNQAGATVYLRGVNTEGTQYDCAQSGAGFYDDSTVSPGSYTTEINAMKSWGINVVRVNLNEECWLGINGVPSTTTASAGSVPAGDTFDTKVNAYMNEMGNYVKALNAAGIYTEIDLHLNAPGTELITDASTDAQNPLPESNSDTFWKSVASYFNSNHAVIFGLFNEPFAPNAKDSGDSSTGWSCTINGCTVPDYTKVDSGNYDSAPPSATYAGVGMKALVNDIRSVNTTAPLLGGGPDFAGDMDDWLTSYQPGGTSIDPQNKLGASVHIYFPNGNSPCATSSAVTTECGGDIMPVAAKVPVEVDELGDFTCPVKNTTQVAPFIQSVDAADASTTSPVDIGYVGWSWTTSSCDPTLISSFTTGAPAVMGEAFYCELLNGKGPGLPAAQSTFSSSCSGANPK